MTDDGRRIHWQGEDGRLLHPITNLSRPPLTSGDEDEVDCSAVPPLPPGEARDPD
jgi:hypothetical protein